MKYNGQPTVENRIRGIEDLKLEDGRIPRRVKGVSSLGNSPPPGGGAQTPITSLVEVVDNIPPPQPIPNVSQIFRAVMEKMSVGQSFEVTNKRDQSSLSNLIARIKDIYPAKFSVQKTGENTWRCWRIS